MDIEHTLKHARRLEDAQQWGEALDAYRDLAEELERREEPDPVVYGRIGELWIKKGDTPAAVEAWENAIEAHLLQGESDNALAICRKIVRYSPGREELYLRMGQIRARQGLLIYARKHFLTYAETVGQRGNVKEAIRALEELVSWVPSDLETRVFLAERLVDEGQREKALVYLREGFWRALWEEDEKAMAELRPRILELDPGADLELKPQDTAQGSGEPSRDGAPTRTVRKAEDEGGIWARILQEEIRRRSEPQEEAAATSAEVEPQPDMPADEPGAVETEPDVAPDPSEPDISTKAPGAPGAPAPTEAAEPASAEAPAADPVPAPRSAATRSSDFATLLSQFKAQTASRPDEREAEAQYQRGVEEHERGAPGRAIALFDRALGIREDFLPAYEMLGRCHLERGEPQSAISKLEPALDLPIQVEDDLLGVFYLLGRAHESMGNLDEAKGWYERVFAVDINYQDVIERLRPLR